MFIKFFRTRISFQQISLLLIISLLLWLDVFINPGQIAKTENPSPLFYQIYKLLENHYWINTILAFLILLSEGIFLNYIIRNENFISRNSYLPMLIFFILMSSSTNLLTITPALFSNLFLILSLRIIFNFYDEEEPFLQVFNAGFFIAIASLFYLPSAIFLLLFWISFFVFSQYTWRNWLISIIGFITPYLFLIVYYFWFDKLEIFVDNYLMFFMNFNSPIADYSIFAYVFLISFVFLLLLSLNNLLLKLNEKVIKIRKLSLILIWFIVFAIFSFVYAGSNLIIHSTILFIPASVIIANYFFYVKKLFWVNVLFTIMLLAIFLDKFNLL